MLHPAVRTPDPMIPVPVRVSLIPVLAALNPVPVVLMPVPVGPTPVSIGIAQDGTKVVTLGQRKLGLVTGRPCVLPTPDPEASVNENNGLQPPEAVGQTYADPVRVGKTFIEVEFGYGKPLLSGLRGLGRGGREGGPRG